MTPTARRTIRAALVPLTAAALLAGVFTVAPAAQAGAKNPDLPAAGRTMMSGWMPYYTADSSLASFEANADVFGDVTGFWHSATGTSTISDQLSDTSRAAIVSAVHAKGVKILGAVTDGTPAHQMSAILTHAAGRTAHVKALVALAVANDYDGIDLDYEKFAFSDGSSTWPDTQRRWTAFVKELSAALHARGLWLTVAVPVMYDSDRDGSSGYWVYDYAGIGPYVDRLRIMTYDYSTSSTGPIAPLSWVRRVLDYATSVVSASKIQLGVPAYGRDWPSSTAGCPVDNMPKRETYTSAGALAVAKAQGVTPTWSSTNGERTFSYKKTYSGENSIGDPASCTVTRTVWFEEQSAAITRARLVGEYKLGGLAQWTVGGEDPAQWQRIRDYALTISRVSPRLELFAGDSTYAHPMKVSARLTWASGTPIAGQSWALYWRNAGWTTWTRVASGKTESNGTVHLTQNPTRNGYWKMYVGGSWTRYPAWTVEDRTLVKIGVSAGFTKSSVKVNSPFTLKGSIGPDAAGFLVERQYYSNGAWSTVGTTTTKADGTYTMTATPTTKGTKTYRIRVSGSTVRAPGYSASIHIVVT